jgi:triacylglycerol esterase/lipase EstA (alpha/beta hydrolase family)
MLDALAPARRRFVLGVGAVIALALVVVLALTLVGREPAVTPVAQDAQPPVLLVPGYGGSTTGLTVLAGALRRDGRTARVVDLGPASTGDLHAQATILDEAVRAALAASGGHSVDLVGYSAGGVTVRVWMAEHRGGDVARRIVTLGSPHHGTDLAALAADLGTDVCPRACRQLVPDSRLLRALNTHDETPAGPRWVSIWTTDDRTVVPPTSASLSGALDFSVQSVCPGRRVTHQGLPSDAVVVAMTAYELGRTLPSRPGSDVCTVSR